MSREDEGILSISDAAEIGIKVVEMADRVKVGNSYMPGAEAKWAFEMDGTRFSVTVSVAGPQSPTGRQG